MAGDERTKALGQQPAAPAIPSTDDVQTFVAGAKARTKVGAVVVDSGQNAGTSFDVCTGTNPIGRDARNAIVLGWDDAVSRDSHALIVHDEKTGGFTLYDGGKVNPVFLNGTAVRAPTPLKAGDTITVGRTPLRFGTG